ncbi:hypothetical protein ACJX0J_010642, partial [Zea mays]
MSDASSLPLREREREIPSLPIIEEAQASQCIFLDLCPVIFKKQPISVGLFALSSMYDIGSMTSTFYDDHILYVICQVG